MEPLQNQSPTFETVWMLLQETAKSLKETDRMLEKSRIETEQEREKFRAEFDKMVKESEERREKSRIEFDRTLEKSRIEFDRTLEKSRIESERRMKKIEETMGAWSNNHGFFAEEYFFNSFENGKQNFFGEKFDEIEKNIKGLKKDFKDEYDILLINGKSIGIIEVKFKAHENDVPQVLRKAETFRVNFPEYKNHSIYLGLATMVFYPELENECIKQGIAVVKQVGDTVVINDTNLKIF